jgi:hypothetical protein
MRVFWNRLLRHLAIGTIVGIVAGGIAGGLGSRLAMRITALMTEPRLQGTLTEAQARVGEITASGTVFLIFFAALFGIYGGLLYRLTVAWLPAKTWQKGLGFGIFLLLSHGTMIIEGDNFDFSRFGSMPVNLAMFILIPIAFAFIAAYLDAWLEARYPVFAFRPKSLLLHLPALLGAFVMMLVASVQILHIRSRGLEDGLGGTTEQVWLSLGMIGLMIAILLAEPFLKRFAYGLQLRVVALIIPALYGGFLLFQAINHIITRA